MFLFFILLLQKGEEKSPIGPYLLAFFVFVVCGSGKCKHLLKIHVYSNFVPRL